MADETTIADAIREKAAPTLRERGAAAWAWVQARAVWIIVMLALPYVVICWALAVLFASLISGAGCGAG